MYLHIRFTNIHNLATNVKCNVVHMNEQNKQQAARHAKIQYDQHVEFPATCRQHVTCSISLGCNAIAPPATTVVPTMCPSLLPPLALQQSEAVLVQQCR